METKSRQLPRSTQKWTKSCVQSRNQNDGLTPGTGPWHDSAESGSNSSSGFQVTESEPHPSINGKYESGGPFFTTRTETDRRNGLCSLHRLLKFTQFSWEEVNASSAPILYPQAAIEAFNSSQLGSASKDTSHLDPIGAEAISRCAPANPADELGTGVSELYREGLPSLPGVQTWQKRTAIAKAAGSEYLNKVFGWDPLVTEVKNFTKVVKRHRDIMKQYERDAGRNVRRTFSFPVSSSSETIKVGEGRCSLGGVTFPTFYEETRPGKYSITRGTSVKRWFSGAFTYDVPSQSDSWQKALGYGSEADVVYGASLNPELLWNLTPWSWAVDWFSNTGDVINNISNYVRAGQVMRYGYMMETTEDFITLTMDSSGWKRIPAPRPWKQSRVTKVRRAANPFGFGLSFSGMSTEQVLIAAALGLTLL